jgi:hypothetical protein
MWVSVVLGFDESDGQLVAKWREAFQRHGTLMGEFFQEEEWVEDLRRHTSVARIKLYGKDVLPPLLDASTRVARGKTINVSGIAAREPWHKYHAQAWRMEVISIDEPPADLPVATRLSDG